MNSFIETKSLLLYQPKSRKILPDKGKIYLAFKKEEEFYENIL